MTRPGWKRILKEADVQRGYDNLARGSELTATDRARILQGYLTVHRLTTRGLVDLAKKTVLVRNP